MDVSFLVPGSHELQTGGNVYNRRIAETLEPETSIRLVPWSPEDVAPRLDPSHESVIVVDSLLARTPEVVRALSDGHSSAMVVLLVHYLRCIDPSVTAPEPSAAERAVLREVDAAITTSEFARQAVIEEGFAPDRVAVVPPGLHDRYRRPLPMRPSRPMPHLLTVANLVPEKGLHSFVDVLRDLQSRSWRWTLVGDASLDYEYARDVFERIRTAGLSERVTYAGVVPPPTVRLFYDRADVFVLPSRFETRGLSMREAMARGLPVVGYRVGGLPENLGDAPAGSLVPPGNAAQLGSALEALLTDPMMRARKGRAAWRQSRSFPTWQAGADAFRERLRLLEQRTAGG